MQLIDKKYFKEKKAKIYNDEENSAFDLLFQEEKPKFEKGYSGNQLYFFIGIALFLIACYLMIHFNEERQPASNINEPIKKSNLDGITTVVFEGNGKELKTQKPRHRNKKAKSTTQIINHKVTQHKHQQIKTSKFQPIPIKKEAEKIIQEQEIKLRPLMLNSI